MTNQEQMSFQQRYADALEVHLKDSRLTDATKEVAIHYGNVVAASSDSPIAISERLTIAEESVTIGTSRREIDPTITTAQVMAGRLLAKRAFLVTANDYFRV